jgi:hypothetical protein
MNQALYAHMNNKRKMKKKKSLPRRSNMNLSLKDEQEFGQATSLQEESKKWTGWQRAV